MDHDFLDVTIHCQGKQLKAHKVILSACSNTFRTILRDTSSPNPVIVLLDVEPRDVSALLDFMYNGQVDIQQDDLERFLVIAERLQIRGLTSGEEPDSEQTRKRHLESVSAAFKPAKLSRSDHPGHAQSSSDHLVIHNHKPETREVALNHRPAEVKTELPDEKVINARAHSVVTLPHRSPALAHNAAVGPIKKRNLNTETITNHHGGGVNNHNKEEEYTTETVDYPGDNTENYPLEQTENYEEFYDEDGGYANAYNNPIDYSMDNSPGKSSKSVKCPYCDKVLKYRHNLKGHIQNQHGAGEPEAPCPICPDKIFKNSASLRDHMSRKHRGEKAAAMTAGSDKLSSAAASPAANLSTRWTRRNIFLFNF